MARRGLLGYQRTEEVTADRSAITYLEATGQSAKGMLKTFQRFQSALSLSGTQVDPYQISHPMPRDRIANLETLADAPAPISTAPTRQALQLRHDMMRAKIAVYTAGPGSGVAAVPQESAQRWRAQYGDAQATLLFGNPTRGAEESRRAYQAAAEEPIFPRTARRHPAAGQTSPNEAANLRHARSASIRQNPVCCRSPMGRR